MFLIRNEGDPKSILSPESHQAFLQKCKDYIEILTQKGQLIAAQPLIREGRVLSKNDTTWIETPLNESKEVQVGYYHILAKDLDEAIEIAKRNPEFEYVSSARIEVRPIKTKEITTGFVYPK
ncbi:Uncharacterized conserved protein [Pseudarcicella hirudinis]|uniref:Uncharacterized conserved protein n=2 Tax=Pseudarcicella hirudinis TaxID=1079859 RepID=A0A1I5YMQ7_9BACT|nr:Uncharacterized conserved protein [Pseudarcicella hirudinis]